MNTLKKILKYLLISILGLVVISVIITSVRESSMTAEEKTARDVAEAHRHRIGIAEVTCQMAIEKQAHDPGSIQWLRQERQFEYNNRDHTLATSIQPFRARNAMGASILTGTICLLKRDGDRWEIIKMSKIR